MYAAVRFLHTLYIGMRRPRLKPKAARQRGTFVPAPTGGFYKYSVVSIERIMITTEH